MIITCPDCAARYDVDDDRFSPNGRSVRCTACGESWYVPAPELLDVEPIEDLKPVQRADHKSRDAHRGEKSSSRLKVRAIEDEEARADDFEDDDSLFDEPGPEKSVLEDLPRDERGRFMPRKKTAAAEDRVEKGWRKGKQFIVEDDEADDSRDEPRRSFLKRRKREDEARREDEGRRDTTTRARHSRREEVREALRFSDADADDDDLYDDNSYDQREEGVKDHFAARRRAEDTHDADYDDAYDDGYDKKDFEDGYDNDRDGTIVDADFEDVDGAHPRGFGRRIRAERRRATAVARVEDVRPFTAEYFDEEFFASLRVTPKELERALRKARRRAESREKNRMTPLRAFGWTAWAAMIVGVIYVAVNYRDDIVRMAPQTADAYAVIGIETNPYGLSIDNVNHRLAMSTAGPTIEITGSLRNASEASADAPLLQAEALGARGELLSRWTFSASEVAVGQGESIEFVTRAPAPEGVAEVALSFAPAQSAASGLLPDGS